MTVHSSKFHDVVTSQRRGAQFLMELKMKWKIDPNIPEEELISHNYGDMMQGIKVKPFEVSLR